MMQTDAEFETDIDVIAQGLADDAPGVEPTPEFKAAFVRVAKTLFLDFRRLVNTIAGAPADPMDLGQLGRSAADTSGVFTGGFLSDDTGQAGSADDKIDFSAAGRVEYTKDEIKRAVLAFRDRYGQSQAAALIERLAGSGAKLADLLDRPNLWALTVEEINGYSSE